MASIYTPVQTAIGVRLQLSERYHLFEIPPQQDSQPQAVYELWQRSLIVTTKKARLIDVRQIGPKSERDISGVCSCCGTVLLARIDEAAEGSFAERLRERLATLFDLHVKNKH